MINEKVKFTRTQKKRINRRNDMRRKNEKLKMTGTKKLKEKDSSACERLLLLHTVHIRETATLIMIAIINKCMINYL